MIRVQSPLPPYQTNPFRERGKTKELPRPFIGAILRPPGSGSPFIIEAETGLIWSPVPPRAARSHHQHNWSCVAEAAAPLLLCNYSKEREELGGGVLPVGKKKVSCSPDL